MKSIKKYICGLLLALPLLGCHKEVCNEMYKPYPKRTAAAYVQRLFAPAKKDADIGQMLAGLEEDTKSSMKRIKSHIQKYNELEASIKQDEQELRQYAREAFGTDYHGKDAYGMLDQMNKDLDERIRTAQDLIAIANQQK